jgi:hypothetical protein
MKTDRYAQYPPEWDEEPSGHDEDPASHVEYLVTWEYTVPGSRTTLRTTTPVFADSEHDAADQIRARYPRATVLASTHHDA